VETTTRIHADELRPEVQLPDLAWDLASGGFERHEVAIRQVVRWARAAGVSTVLVGILADRSEPEVTRLRAFGQVAATLAATRFATGDHVHHNAA
jgi:hypothetical protein